MREIIAAPTPGLDLRHHYGHHQTVAIRAGGLIFCSGMVAVNPDTGEREHGTVTSEARRPAEATYWIELAARKLASALGKPCDFLATSMGHEHFHFLGIRRSRPAHLVA